MWLLAYLILSFGLSWSVFACGYSQGFFKDGIGVDEGPYLFAFMWGPAIAAVLLASLNRGKANFAVTLGLRFRPSLWWILAWLAPIVLAFAALPISELGGVRIVSPETAGQEILKAAEAQTGSPIDAGMTDAQLFWASLANAVIIGALINSVLLLSEELGWRGFMWWRLRPLGFWPASLMTGVIWGLWHAPVIYSGYNYPGMGWAGVAMMVAFCIVLSPLISAARELGRSVFGASIFHGTLNAIAGVSVLLIPGAPVTANGVIGWPGIVLMAAACLGLALLFRPSRESASQG